MNSVAVALAEAAATAKTRAELSGAFDRAWSRVEFAPDAESVVVGVPADAARAWWFGDLSDVELALSVTKTPGAIWWAAFPRLSAYRPGIAAVRRLYDAGATVYVSQARNPIIIAHAKRWGFRAHQIDDEHVRFLGEGEVLRRWLRAL